MDDRELVRQWALGDRLAGEQLIRRHFGTVYRMFVGKVPIAADDLVQQTFLACVEQRAELDRAHTFRAFVLGIARHKLYAFYRERMRGPASFDPHRASALEALAATGGYSHELARTRLREALLALPLESQLLIELRYFEELNSRELGAVFDCNPATLRSRLVATRRLLKTALVERGESRDLDGLLAAGQ